MNSMNLQVLTLAVDMNQLGVERLNRGETIQAVAAFQQALLLSVFNLDGSIGLGDIVGLDEIGVLLHDFGTLSPRNNVAVATTYQHEQVFMRPLLINRAHFQEALFTPTRSDTLLTTRATVLINLALSVQVASEQFGCEKWSEEAVFLYQTAADYLYAIDDALDGVLLAMYALHNVAQIYYEMLEYAKCRACLEGLRDVLCYGCAACPSLFLGCRQYIERIMYTIHFLSRPPTTAACA